jgi:hypothetical protein
MPLVGHREGFRAAMRPALQRHRSGAFSSVSITCGNEPNRPNLICRFLRLRPSARISVGDNGRVDCSSSLRVGLCSPHGQAPSLSFFLELAHSFQLGRWGRSRSWSRTWSRSRTWSCRTWSGGIRSRSCRSSCTRRLPRLHRAAAAVWNRLAGCHHDHVRGGPRSARESLGHGDARRPGGAV